MTYDPQSEDAFRVGLLTARGDGSTWPTLLDNDARTYELTTPGLEVNVLPSFSALGRTYRFRMRGNADDCDVQVDVRAAAVSGPHDVDIATGVTSTVNVTTDAWYGDAINATGQIQNVVVAVPTIGSGTVQIQAIRAHFVGVPPVAGTLYASGYRRIGARWKASNAPIATGQLSRILSNAARVAIERPVCVTAHVSDCEEAISGKSSVHWGVEDSAAWATVGRTKVPRVDNSLRVYTVDAYTVESSSGGQYRVNIGGVEETWTGTGWHSWTVRLGPGPHDVRASILPGASNEASIRTLQVWRSQ